LLDSASLGAEERRKHLVAMERAVPVTRMVDYGVPLGDALLVHESTKASDPDSWDCICERLASGQRDIATVAEDVGRRDTAAQAWRSAYALLQCAQLAYNHDHPRKLSLYEQGHAALTRHAHLSDDLEEVRLPTDKGHLHGWMVRPVDRAPSRAVVVIGGLSGWGGVYLDMGRALAARGVLAVLAEGPGQGLSRMRGGMHLDEATLPLFSAFVDHAESLGIQRFGAWGNSFGGLFSAHLAARDKRIKTLCINGAPMTPGVPKFRTAREQMEAVFGVNDEVSLARRLKYLSMEANRHSIAAHMLVLQGGCDSLVPLEEQSSFFTLAPTHSHETITWRHGEHAIYNHAPERNARAADWFSEMLT
jgi:dienelactone hydrolase